VCRTSGAIYYLGCFKFWSWSSWLVSPCISIIVLLPWLLNVLH
jgi:hypothetical protein